MHPNDQTDQIVAFSPDRFLNIAYLDTIRETIGHEQTIPFKQLLLQFDDEVQNVPQRLQEALHNQSTDEVIRLLHQLRGLCSQFGASFLVICLQTIEKKVLKQDDSSHELLIQLAHVVQLTSRALHQYLSHF
jgi:HPt (histidine-containing phosphotransfer) domain-containing protein